MSPPSPRLLTPEADTMTHSGQLPTDPYLFPKNPVAKPKHSGAAQPPSPTHKPLSLLSALVESNNHLSKRQTRPASLSGLSSQQSSVPSTAISSPNGHHGLLNQPQPPTDQPASILRRGSSSSDYSDAVGLGLGTNTLDGLAGKLEKVEERRERIEWADEVAPAESVPLISRAASLRTPCLKFAMAPMLQAASASDSGSGARRSMSPGARNSMSPAMREREISAGIVDATGDAKDSEESSDDEEQVLPAYLRRPDPDDSDPGYQEDEEDGEFSEDDAVPWARSRSQSTGQGEFPFARPTNYDPHHPEQLLSSPNASASSSVVPPPPRRGRGHVRVDAEGMVKRNKCSRHCSPPPQRSRSSSNTHVIPPASSSPSARRLKRQSASPSRVADAGPRPGRAGSPMPFRGDSQEEDESEEEEQAEEEPSNPHCRGWRSDDAVFYGPQSQTVRGLDRARLARPPRNVSAPPRTAVFDDSGDESMSSPPPQAHFGAVGDGVRDFFRRASEHLPIFTSGSQDRSPQPDLTPLSAPLPSQPILDSTPAIAGSLSRPSDPQDLTFRLERSLSRPAGNLSRARSAGSRVTFDPETRSHRPAQALTLGNFGVDHHSRPVACPARAQKAS